MTSKSATKLIPADPSKVMVIRDVAPSITTFSVPFLRFGHIKIGGRGTAIKLQSGSIAVFSPVALTPEVEAKIQSMGNNVKYLAALDFEHHIFLGPWAKAFPNAQIIGVDGLPEKREADKATAGLKFASVFTASTKKDSKISEEFDREFEYEYFHSHVNKELVFFHKPSKTVIEADLIFNLPATEQYSKTGINPSSGLLTKLFGGLQHTHGSAIWQQRFLWYAAGGKDRKSFAQSVAAVDKWDFDRLIPCHGDVIETGAKSVYRKVMAWFLEEAKK